MAAIVEFPQVVREALEPFADLFSCEPQRRHFAEYLTGLMVARKKSVTGINAEFADTTDPSCLNRFVTQVEWDVEQLNERRLELLQRDPSTRYHDQGVIALDDVLIDHTGQVDQRRRLVLGSCRRTEQDCSRLSVRQLRDQQWQTLPAGVSSL